MIVLSTITFIISTADELQKDENGNLEFPLVVYMIELLDNFVTIFFSAEFLTRLIICPRKYRILVNSRTCQTFPIFILPMMNHQTLYIFFLKENKVFEKVHEHRGPAGDSPLLHLVTARYWKRRLLIEIILLFSLEGLEEFEVVGKTGKIIRLIRKVEFVKKNSPHPPLGLWGSWEFSNLSDILPDCSPC